MYILLFFHNILSLKFIHIAKCSERLFFFYFHFCVLFHLLIYPSGSGPLGCFLTWDGMNAAAVNIYVQSLGSCVICLEVELLG